MEYFAGQASVWRAHALDVRSARRVRYNPATGFFEAIGAGAPAVAYRTREEAERSTHLPE